MDGRSGRGNARRGNTVAYGAAERPLGARSGAGEPGKRANQGHPVSGMERSRRKLVVPGRHALQSAPPRGLGNRTALSTRCAAGRTGIIQEGAKPLETRTAGCRKECGEHPGARSGPPQARSRLQMTIRQVADDSRSRKNHTRSCADDTWSVSVSQQRY